MKTKLKGVDVNQLTKNGLTLLSLVAGYGWLDAVKYLVEEKGADIDQINKHGKTPLHQACIGGFVDIVEYLIKKGADINKVDGKGNTPLHITAAVILKNSTSTAILNSLIEAGANIKENIDGRTPLDLTKQGDPTEALELLIKFTLLNDPTYSNKPSSIKENKELSAYGDEKALRINDSSESKLIGDKNTEEKILKRGLSYGKDSLPNPTDTQFFKRPKISAIKSETSNESDQTRLKIN